MIVLVGLSGAGKDTIANELVKSKGFRRILEVTTRLPRKNEVNGKDYWFVSELDFKNMEEKGELVGVRSFTRAQNPDDPDDIDTVWYASRKCDVDSSDEDTVLTTNPGAMEMLKAYAPNKIWSCNLTVSPVEQRIRFNHRGDFNKETERRLESDRIAQENLVTDYKIDTSYSCIWCVCEDVYNMYKGRHNK